MQPSLSFCTWYSDRKLQSSGRKQTCPSTLNGSTQRHFPNNPNQASVETHFRMYERHTIIQIPILPQEFWFFSIKILFIEWMISINDNFRYRSRKDTAELPSWASTIQWKHSSGSIQRSIFNAKLATANRALSWGRQPIKLRTINSVVSTNYGATGQPYNDPRNQRKGIWPRGVLLSNHFPTFSIYSYYIVWYILETGSYHHLSNLHVLCWKIERSSRRVTGPSRVQRHEKVLINRSAKTTDSLRFFTSWKKYLFSSNKWRFKHDLANFQLKWIKRICIQYKHCEFVYKFSKSLIQKSIFLSNPNLWQVYTCI